eukprot:NODE_2273_length_1227_cov_21.659091_g2161_i0.p1 GENE.NODE_2273_length_1227_cov_21.659091_g2161_i0~~NODE_2273_length_1227_cov_21.659091_g2161_i0.p1  ORF type:complete len:321 (-),score=56.95 NODE_2273_length_1227_cov_21.659091_g2161_i0:265-1176(-)
MTATDSCSLELELLAELGFHPPPSNTLCRPWTLWKEGFVKSAFTKQTFSTDLECLDSVQDWMEFWERMPLLVARTPPMHSVHIFQQGIPPVYDHPRTLSGCHFKLRPKPHQTIAFAHAAWIQLCAQLTLETIPCMDHVLGITLAKKARTHLIKLWISNSRDVALIHTIKHWLATEFEFDNLRPCPHKYLVASLNGRTNKPQPHSLPLPHRCNTAPPNSLCPAATVVEARFENDSFLPHSASAPAICPPTRITSTTHDPYTAYTPDRVHPYPAPAECLPLFSERNGHRLPLYVHVAADPSELFG